MKDIYFSYEKGSITVNGTIQSAKERLSISYMVMQEVNHQLVTIRTHRIAGKRAKLLEKYMLMFSKSECS